MAKPISELGIKGKVLGSMKSDSSDEVYTISEHEGKLACTCIGYATTRKKPKTCKHIRRYYLTNILEGIVARSVDEQNTISQKDLEHEVAEIEQLFKKEV